MNATHPQAGILLPPPTAARHLEWSLRPGVDARAGLQTLASLVDGTNAVAGLGLSLVRVLGLHVEGLRTLPALVGEGIDIPSTPRALWVWLRGEDRGELLHRSRRLEKALAPTFRLESERDAFFHDGGRDLTGYEDGTENPQGEAATEVAIVAEGPLAGSSFVAVQSWVHDLERFAAFDKSAQDRTYGRERISNVEMADAPDSAHVKRTAQEGFDPPSFVVRRSMPWSGDGQAGLVFVSFASSLDPFERQMRRMVGLDDGIVDGLFGFTRAVSGAFYWCPPVRGGKLAIDAAD